MMVYDYKFENFVTTGIAHLTHEMYVWTTFGSWTIQWRLPCDQATRRPRVRLEPTWIAFHFTGLYTRCCRAGDMLLFKRQANPTMYNYKFDTHIPTLF